MDAIRAVVHLGMEICPIRELRMTGHIPIERSTFRRGSACPEYQGVMTEHEKFHSGAGIHQSIPLPVDQAVEAFGIEIRSDRSDLGPKGTGRFVHGLLKSFGARGQNRIVIGSR